MTSTVPTDELLIALTDDDLDVIESCGAQGMTGRITGYEIKHLVAAYRLMRSTPPASAKNETGIEPVGYRWRFEDEEKWTVQKKVPHWYTPDQRDIILEPIYSATQLADITRHRDEAITKLEIITTAATTFENRHIKAEARIAELEARVKAGAVQVKPLEWSKRHESEFLTRAETVLGIYRVWSHHEADGQWFWELSDFLGHRVLECRAGSEPEAKSAAQADFDQRIRSALTASPQAPGVEVTEEMAEAACLFAWPQFGEWGTESRKLRISGMLTALQAALGRGEGKNG